MYRSVANNVSLKVETEVMKRVIISWGYEFVPVRTGTVCFVEVCVNHRTVQVQYGNIWRGRSQVVLETAVTGGHTGKKVQYDTVILQFYSTLQMS